MKKHLLLFSSLLLTLFFFSSCEGPLVIPCERGSGPTVSQNIGVSNFDEVELQISGTVKLKRDSVFNVEVQAQQDIIDVLQFEVTGNNLEIGAKRCIRSDREILIVISMPEVQLLDLKGSGNIIGLDRFDTQDLKLRISGSGDIEFACDAKTIDAKILGSGNLFLDVAADDIESKISGSGDIVVEGTSLDHYMDIDGSGDVSAFDLTTDNSDVKITGSGSARLHADQDLGIRILGSGDVFYTGNPALTINITGSGEVIDLN